MVRLTATEEVRLGERVAAGDESALDTLVRRNEPMVHKIAAGFGAPGFERKDFIQEGMVALVEAARRWRPSAGVRFGSFAWPWISGRLKKLYQRSPMIGNHHLAKKRGDVLPFVETIYKVDGQGEPYTEDHEDPRALHEQLACEARADLDGFLSGARLTPTQRIVIVGRFGLGGETQRTLSQLSVELGVCRERIRQIEVEALERLRGYVAGGPGLAARRAQAARRRFSKRTAA